MTCLMFPQRGDLLQRVAASKMAHMSRMISTPVVVAIDLWIGLVWIFLPASYWSTPFYSPAHRVMAWLPYPWQFRAWGVLIIALSLGWFFRRPGHEQLARFCIAGLFALWTFWVILTFVGWINSHVGGLLPPLTVLAARAHWPGRVYRAGPARGAPR